jgi:multiple sugar transport system ATP-binding protein
MTVYDNIAFPLKMRKMTSEEISRKVKHTAQMLRIEHLLYRKPGQISGGEAQRVALGRAIVRDPEVFLMDEPLSNLDAKLRVYMRAELKKLQKELGTTTIFVTHDQVEAMTVADKIAIMNLGKLQQVGTPIEIFDKPANQFVAGFIGSPPMNFMECTFVEKNNHYLLDAGTFEIEISEDVGNKIKKEASGSELILGIRPDDIRLEKLVKAEVYLIEPLGREVIIDLKVGDHVLKMKTAFTNFDINVGENIWIGFNKEKIHIFDKKTEKVII